MFLRSLRCLSQWRSDSDISETSHFCWENPISFKIWKKLLLSAPWWSTFWIFLQISGIKFFSTRQIWIPRFFRKGILQIKWVSFYNLNFIFKTNLIFLLLSFMFNFFHPCSTYSVQFKLTQIFYGSSPWKKRISEIKHSSLDSIQKCVDELICECFF